MPHIASILYIRKDAALFIGIYKRIILYFAQLPFSPMTKYLRPLALTLLCAATFTASAQGWGGRVHKPGNVTSDSEAIRRYEAGQVRALLNRCEKAETSAWADWEQKLPGDGWLYRAYAPTERLPVGAYIWVSPDKRLAQWVDYQALDGSNRLHLKLALPRDYGRCRVVTSSAGEMRLEVANRIQIASPAASTLWQQFLSQPKQTPAECSAQSAALWTIQNDVLSSVPVCTAAQKANATAVQRLALELYDEGHLLD